MNATESTQVPHGRYPAQAAVAFPPASSSRWMRSAPVAPAMRAMDRGDLPGQLRVGSPASALLRTLPGVAARGRPPRAARMFGTHGFDPFIPLLDSSAKLSGTR